MRWKLCSVGTHKVASKFEKRILELCFVVQNFVMPARKEKNMYIFLILSVFTVILYYNLFFLSQLRKRKAFS